MPADVFAVGQQFAARAEQGRRVGGSGAVVELLALLEPVAQPEYLFGVGALTAGESVQGTARRRLPQPDHGLGRTVVPEVHTEDVCPGADESLGEQVPGDQMLVVARSARQDDVLAAGHGDAQGFLHDHHGRAALHRACTVVLQCGAANQFAGLFVAAGTGGGVA